MLDVLEVLDRLDKSTFSAHATKGIIMEALDDLRSQGYSEEKVIQILNMRLFGEEILTAEDIAWYDMLNTEYDDDEDDD